MKELKVRPGTDVHDYEVRLRAAQKFLAKVWHSAAVHRSACLPGPVLLTDLANTEELALPGLQSPILS